MVEDRTTAQICNKYESFVLLNTSQADFGWHGYSISAWEDRDGNIYEPMSTVWYSDISSVGDDDTVHFFARWKKNWYNVAAVKVPRQCMSQLSGFDQPYEYESSASVSAGNDDENYRFVSWMFPDGSVSTDNPIKFKVLSAVELSVNYKDLRTLLMWTKPGRMVMLRYRDISSDLDSDRKNVLRYRARAGNGTCGPFNVDQDLSAPSSLTILSVAEESINVIDQSAFIDCKNLWNIGCSFISSVEASAFANCGKLEHMQTPDLVLVSSYAFAGCSSLDSASLPKALSICENAFAGCQAMASVYAPVVTDILSGAFLSCTGLTSVNFPKLSSIGSMAFDCGLSDSALVGVTCPDLKQAAPSAFYGCGNLTSIEGVSGICRAEDSVFAGCGKLKTLTLLSADILCANALSGCESLVALNASNVTAFGQNVFTGCSSLKRIDFGYTLSTVPSLLDHTFDGLTGIACYIPKDNDLYERWTSDAGWVNAMNNNIYVFQHTQAELAAQSAETESQQE